MNEKPLQVIPIFLTVAIIGSEAHHVLSPPHTRLFFTSEAQSESVHRHPDALPVHAPLGHEDGDNMPKEESLKLSAAITYNVTASISIPYESLQSVSTSERLS